MSRNALSPRLTGALYAAAGVLFLVGAFSSDQPAFAALGIAFLALALLITSRARRR